MPSCEKCWSDSACSSQYNDHASEYRKLMDRRDREGRQCTPEQQAGPEATACPKCGRVACHQWCHICMACGYKPGEAGL
jgi:hypothetical protein